MSNKKVDKIKQPSGSKPQTVAGQEQDDRAMACLMEIRDVLKKHNCMINPIFRLSLLSGMQVNFEVVARSLIQKI